MIGSTLSIKEPCTTDGSVRPRVVSAAPDSKDHAMCRQFYRDVDWAKEKDEDFTPYNGWLPPETAASLEHKRRGIRIDGTLSVWQMPGFDWRS
jgi:hypothetical protein